MFAGPPKVEGERPPVWFTGTLALGLTLSLAFFFLIRGWERREREKQAANIVDEQLEKLRISMFRSIEVLYSLRSLFQAEGGIEPREFETFVHEALRRQPELQALSWNPVVLQSDRATFEAHSGFPIRERDPLGRLAAAPTREIYVPVHLIQPLPGNHEALGYDLRSDPLRRASLERAAETGNPTGTPALRLAQGPRDLTGLLVILPVFPVVPSSSPSQPAGYAVAVFRVAALVHGAFAEMRRHGIQAVLHDSSGSVLFSNLEGAPRPSGAKDLEFAGYHWAVVYYPTPHLAPGARRLQSWLVLLAGLAFTAITSAYLWSSWRRAQEAFQANAALEIEIAERKRAEESADRANRAKSDFLASMSHEIRTPLNAILGYTQLLQKDLHLSPEQRDSIAGIHGSGMHLLGLINEVLDLSKIEAGRMELHAATFSLESLARSISATFRPLCAQKRIGLHVAIEARGHSQNVRGDEGKLRQVLINLLGNAVKFTVVGAVSLRIQYLDAETWLFEVADSGVGIPDDEKASIFEPFHQGKGAQHFGGTGLGLAIAHRQVELMGGSLRFASERGVGTRFYYSLRLPEAPGHPGDPAPGPHLEEPAVDFPHLLPLALPEDLRSRLLLAAELHSATALKTCLKELRDLGGETAPLAQEIRKLMRSYDMHAIQHLLERVVRPAAPHLPHGLGKA